MAEDDDDYEQVCQRLLEADPSLMEIATSRVESVLLDGLTNNSTITTLSIEDCLVGDEAAVAIASMSALTKLCLRNVGLTVAGARKLAASSSWKTLRVVDLRDNPKLGPRGIQPLADKFANSTCLQELILSNCRLGHFGAKALGTSGLPSTLKVLDLSQNAIGNDGTWKLAPALDDLNNLVSLRLSKNQIGDDGASEIGRQLPSTLELLDLSDNDVADVGVDMIATAAANSRITTLWLSNNKIGNEGAIALGEAVTKSSLLQELNLSYNQIGDEGASGLAEGLGSKNSTVASLSLKNNRIGDAGAGAFVEHLDRNRTLTNLDLSGNDGISSARLHILDMLLKHRTQRRSTESNVEASPDRERTDDTILEESRRLIQNEDAVELSFDYLDFCTNHFDATSLIGYGAFGELYQGSDDDRTYAVQNISTSERDVTEEMLKDIAALRSEGILPLTAYSSDDTFCCLAYDVSDMTPLSKLLSEDSRRKEMHWTSRARIIHNVALGLDALHNRCRRSKFHGDIKSANILVSTDYTAQLLGCGVSQLILADKTRFKGNVVFGTTGYRCPRYERGSRKYSPESDVFSLGIVIAELCTGRMQNDADASTGLSQDFYYDYVVDKRRELTEDIDPLAGTLGLETHSYRMQNRDFVYGQRTYAETRFSDNSKAVW